MQLENPKRQRRLAGIVASLPDSKRTDVVRRLARVDRLMARRHQQDADLADALLRVLKSALGKELRDRIKEICK